MLSTSAVAHLPEIDAFSERLADGTLEHGQRENSDVCDGQTEQVDVRRAAQLSTGQYDHVESVARDTEQTHDRHHVTAADAFRSVQSRTDPAFILGVLAVQLPRR